MVLSAGDSVTIELVATHGAAGMLGADISVEYNDDKLSFASASATADLLAEAQVLLDTTAGRVNLAIEARGEPPSRSGGSLVQITFGVLADLAKETTVRLVSGSFAVEGRTRELVIGAAGSMVVVGGNAVDRPKTPDFSGDGRVDFQDFVLFAQNFGRRLGQSDYDVRFDLDDDDAVAFGDFVIFALSFGQPTG